MKTVTLNQREIIDLLDKLHPNAYDLLQSAIEEKAIDQLGEDAWLKRWETGNWDINLNLRYLDDSEDDIEQTPPNVRDSLKEFFGSQDPTKLIEALRCS